ncbi:MAG: GldG family protein [Methylobacter sp.]|uniref:GldG family protein n=1 Tax=Methylobacter sp. TaxID=2051955 RepID=UPI00258659B1|nr:GldG family protein [Methylobacter sp.]MCL7420622.1 GldG family protein [Methylobacter sp.]
MKISRRIHQRIRVKNLLLTLMLLAAIGGLAWLSTRYTLETDITANAGNTLSPASVKLLASMPDKLAITVYMKADQPIRSQIAQLVDRYKRHKPDLSLTFIDPDTQPEKTRELNIGPAGAILIEYQGRIEKLTFVDESSLTNALLQLANAHERWITFLTGHGERSVEGQANFDLEQFGKELARRKINAQAINLATLPAIPDNSALLVMTAPTVPLLANEIEIINRYIEQGGNLLVLADPDAVHLGTLEQRLGIHRLPGAIMDGSTQLYGITDPSFVLVAEYAPHAITQGFQTTTIYPAAAALEMDAESDFQAEAILSSAQQSWTETGPVKGNVQFDADGDEKQGPLPIVYALTRTVNEKTQQRIVVVGDGDFLSNAYIGNVGNLDMGLRMVNWLIHDDRFIDIPAKTASDKSLQLTETSVAVIGFGFLLAIPLSLMGTGFLIWRRRKRR